MGGATDHLPCQALTPLRHHLHHHIFLKLLSLSDAAGKKAITNHLRGRSGCVRVRVRVRVRACVPSSQPQGGVLGPDRLTVMKSSYELRSVL